MRLLKRIPALFIAFSLIVSMTAAAVATPTYNALSSNTSLIVDGAEKNLTAYNINGSNYFKLRDIAFVLNGSSKQFNVSWSKAENSIKLSSGVPYSTVGGEGAIGFQVSESAALPTGSSVFLDGIAISVEAYNINGNNYFKLRDIMQAIDVCVIWDAKTGSIALETSAGYAASPVYASNTLLTTVQIAAKAESVVMLKLYDKDDEEAGQASGFFISADGRIATCYHAIEGMYRAEAICDDGTVYKISSVLAYDADYDTAIIQAETNSPVIPLALGDSDSLVRGQQIMTIGSPQGEHNTISDGLISGYGRDSKELRCKEAVDIQISAPISKGSSGGPLLDMYGNVVGIIYATHNYGQNMNYAVPMKEFLPLYDSISPISFPDFYELTYKEEELQEEPITSFIY